MAKKRNKIVPWFKVYLKCAFGYQALAFDEISNSAKPNSVIGLRYLRVMIYATFNEDA